MCFYFRVAETEIDLGYMDNADEYMDLCASIARMGRVRATSVNFLGSASPEGTFAGSGVKVCV